VGGVVETWAG